MIKPINTNLQELSRPSLLATRADLFIGQDLQDTLAAHRKHCLGMAANMIGKNKRIIIAQLGPLPVVMFNPQITSHFRPYQTKEGCLSLPGERSVKRYHQIMVRFLNRA